MKRPELVAWWPGALAGGFGLAWAANLDPTDLGGSGLATLALASAGALVLGVPLAHAEWSLAADDSSADLRFAQRIERLWGLLWFAAAAAAVLRPLGTAAVASGIAVWLAWSAVAGRTARLARALGVTFVIAAAAYAASVAPPWTLLAPAWNGGADWAARAVAAGVSFAGAGFGFWTGQPSVPGSRRAPWLAAGIATLGALGVACVAGGAYEHGLSVHPWFPLLALVATAGAVAQRPHAEWRFEGLIGAAALAWFAYPGFAGIPWWFGSFALVGPASLAYRIARGPHPVLGAAAGAALLALGALGWQGPPATMRHAVALAAILVVPTWYAGTFAVLKERRA